jgi:HAD superfamily hydrolase (TIGR01509 family)
VIFDMDGVLLESESRWRIAEAEAAARLGLPHTDADFEQTMGMRMRDIARRWYGEHPWSPIPDPTPDEVADQVIDRVIELVADAEPLPGVVEAIDLMHELGLRVALCSSSDDRLITAATEALGLADRFEVLHSAEHDLHGKPHPEPYLSTASKLGVNPGSCLAIEDSVAGCLSAKSAGMTVVAVPHPALWGSERFGFVDLMLTSLEHLDASAVARLDTGPPSPSLSRPRFHLAFPVDDLDRARWFYGDVLGCPEGRSDTTWVDFDLWGHQIVAHLDPSGPPSSATNDVDGHRVPASHFGLVLPLGAWRHMVSRLRGAGITFLMEPTVRFEGLPGEQHTCFVYDPAGNALEFKAFVDDRQVFSTG